MPLRFHCVRGCWDRSNPGLLRLWHWQPDALTTWLDLIHLSFYTLWCVHPDLPGRGGGRGRRWAWSQSAPPWSRTGPVCSRQGAASGCTLAPLLTVSGILSSTNDPLYVYFLLLLPCSQYPGYCLGTNDPLYVCSLICTLAPLLTVSGIFSGYGWSLVYVCFLICIYLKRRYQRRRKTYCNCVGKVTFFLLTFLFYSIGRKICVLGSIFFLVLKFTNQTKCKTVRESGREDKMYNSMYCIDKKSQWQNVSR